MNCIRPVPCINVDGNTGAIDVAALQKLITLDANADRIPLFLVANVGASLLGETDNIVRLQEVCRINQIWLHCRGHNLASLMLLKGSAELSSVADSMTLNLSNWFGIPGVPTVLLYRPIPNVAPSILFDSDPLLSRYLSAITVWMMLQALGKEAINERILMAFQSCRVLYETVAKVEGLQIVSRPPQTGVSIVELINKPLNSTVSISINYSILIQYY